MALLSLESHQDSFSRDHQCFRKSIAITQRKYYIIMAKSKIQERKNINIELLEQLKQ